MDIISYALLKKNIRGITYRGDYEEGGKYAKGDVVTQGTSIYYCNRDTSNPPSVDGETSKEWLQMLTVEGIEDDIDNSFKEFDLMVTTLLDETKEKVDRILAEVTLSNEGITDFLDNNIHKGKYDSSTKYIKGNEVEFEGSSYRALENVTGESPDKSSKWVLVALRGVDGEGSVSSVNGILPDEDGNIELGDISTDWASLEGKPEVLDKLGESSNKLTYNGKTVGEELVVKHENKIASTSSLGHMQVGEGLKVNSKGVVSVDENLKVDLSDYTELKLFNSHISTIANSSRIGHVRLVDKPNFSQGVSAGRAVTPKALQEVKDIAEMAFTQAASVRAALYKHFMDMLESDESKLWWTFMAMSDDEIPNINEDSTMEDIIKVLDFMQKDRRGKVTTRSITYTGEGNIIELDRNYDYLEVKGGGEVGDYRLALDGKFSDANAILVTKDISGFLLKGVMLSKTGSFVSNIELTMNRDKRTNTWKINHDNELHSVDAKLNLYLTFKEKDDIYD